MKHATSNVRATVLNDLLVHELRHRVSCTTALSTALINLPQICHVLWWRAVDRLVASPQNAVINRTKGPGCWAATCQQQWIPEFHDEAGALFWHSQ